MQFHRKPQTNTEVKRGEAGRDYAVNRLNFGGTEFLETVPVKKGDPKPLTEVQRHYAKVTDARRFEWQYRSAMQFRESPEHTSVWVTLTYAKEPHSWERAREDLAKWLKSVKQWHRRVHNPVWREVAPRESEKLHYIIVEEEGEKNGRKHFHALIWSPYFVKISDWKCETMLKWRHGFAKYKRLQKDHQGLAIYISKYAHKSSGRTKCSFNFGLMTTITLLSISSFRQLVLVNLPMAQSLLRRLSLTPNYPSCKTLTYLLSRDSWSITCLPLKNPKSLQAIGLRMNGSRLLVRTVADEYPGCRSDSVALRCQRLARSTVKTLRHLTNDLAEHALSKALPGLQSFGKPRPVRWSSFMEPGKDTYLWYNRSHYPRKRNLRARLGGV